MCPASFQTLDARMMNKTKKGLALAVLILLQRASDYVGLNEYEQRG